MEILDDDLTQRPNDKRTKNPLFRSSIYILIMLLGGATYAYFFPTFLPSVYVLVVTGITYIVMALIVSVILETFRYFIRQRRERKAEIKTLYDPFWFQVLEGGFAIWLLLMGVIIWGNHVI